MKKLTQWLAATVLSGSVFTFTATAAESPSVLLQKGIYAEETEGNVDAAIKIYEQIAVEAATNRSVVAQAQYRLAVCYQKKGNKEQAIKLIGELVQQPSLDADVNKKARETLTQLGVMPAESVSMRKISVPFVTHWFMSISSNGRYFTYQPDGTDDIALWDSPTGKSWTIYKGMKDMGPWSDAMISPDGQWVAYDVNGAQIFVAKFDGTETRKVFERDSQKTDDYTDVEGWYSDGAQLQLIVGLWPKSDSPVVIGVDLKTGVRKDIARLSQVAKSDGWSFSSDGRYLARRKGAYPRMITLIDLRSSHEESVVEHDAEQVLGWAAGDTKLLFSQNRGTGIDLLSVGVKEGKLTGEPELVWSNFGTPAVIGVTHDNKIYYRTRNANRNLGELWVMEGFLSRSAPAVSPPATVDTPVEDIVRGSDGSILDRKFDLSLTMPKGWTLVRAGRSSTGLSFFGFDAAEFPGSWRVWLQLGYWKRSTAENAWLRQLSVEFPKPTTKDEMSAWLKRFSQLRTESRIKDKGNFTNYLLRADSFVSRTIGGRPALSWLCDYTDQAGRAWNEYVTVIYSEDIVAQPFIQAPREHIAAARSAFDALVETIRSP